MGDSVFEIAVKFFENLENSEEGKKELKRFDRRIEFNVKDDEPFFVDIKDGRASIMKGRAGQSVPEPLRFVTFRDPLVRLFQGKVRYTNLYFYVPGSQDRLQLVSGGSPGTFGSWLSSWVGRLIRIGQEVR